MASAMVANKRTWLANQILKNDWVQTLQGTNARPASSESYRWGLQACVASSWVPQRLRFTRGEVSITHSVGMANVSYPSIDIRINNADWENPRGLPNTLSVDGDTVQELNVCEYSCGCESDSISLTLNENLAGELQLVLTTISTCLCGWGEDRLYETPRDERFEQVTTTYALVDDLRLQYFHPAVMSQLFRQEQYEFILTMMMVGDRCNSTNATLPQIPNEVWVLILKQLRVHELGTAHVEVEDTTEVH